ncbi:MAG: hypothetical protein K1X53_11945 [Candidatus Sumerlaeaceae bacterium]|nr:hypothetical protein [Candidatus Sumerlaeaceae bacterium]
MAFDRAGEVNELQRFAPIISGTARALLVGGQAVNLWCLWSSEHFEDSASELIKWLPFTSKDCDVIGDLDLLREMSQLANLPMRAFRFGQATNLIGYRHHPATPETPFVEVLGGICGMSHADIQKGITEVTFESNLYRTLSPVAMLKAKLANVATIPQEKRQDLRHVQMLIPCVRAYITYAHRQAEEGAQTASFVKKMLTRTLDIVKSPHGVLTQQTHGAKLRNCFPVKLLENSAFASVRNFVDHQITKL